MESRIRRKTALMLSAREEAASIPAEAFEATSSFVSAAATERRVEKVERTWVRIKGSMLMLFDSGEGCLGSDDGLAGERRVSIEYEGLGRRTYLI